MFSSTPTSFFVTDFQAGFAVMSLFYKFRDSPLLSSLSDAAKDKHRRLLEISIRGGDTAMLRLLLSRHGRELDEILNVPLEDSGCYGEEELGTTTTETATTTLLAMGVKTGNAEVVDALIKSGANVKIGDSKAKSALNIAVDIIRFRRKKRKKGKEGKEDEDHESGRVMCENNSNNNNENDDDLEDDDDDDDFNDNDDDYRKMVLSLLCAGADATPAVFSVLHDCIWRLFISGQRLKEVKKLIQDSRAKFVDVFDSKVHYKLRPTVFVQN